MKRMQDALAESKNEFVEPKPDKIARVEIGKETKKLNYQCHKCTKTFAKKNEISDHVVSEHSKIICDICSKLFDHTLALKMHFSNEHFTENILCEKCDKIFLTKELLNEHQLMVHEDAKCAKCDKTFTYLELRNHIGERVSCTPCKVEFCNRVGLTNHLSKCHPHNEGSKCFRCDDIFDKPCHNCHICDDNIMRPCINEKCHRFYRNLPLKYCSKCDFKSCTNNSLQNHIEKSHRQVKKPIEGLKPKNSPPSSLSSNTTPMNNKRKSADKILELGNHSQSQDLNKSDSSESEQEVPCYKCDHCHKAFYWPLNLKKHLKEGKSENLKCDFCGKDFVLACGKDKHMKICDKALEMNTANKEKALKCRNCSKSFSTSHDMVMHHIKDHSVRN